MAQEAGFKALFALSKPCKDCPFNRVGAIELNSGRLEGIIASMLDNDWKTFLCHKTTFGIKGGDWDDEESYIPSGKEAHCMGAMAYLQKVRMPSVPMRIGYANGMLKIGEVRSCEVLVIDEINVEDYRGDQSNEED